jgi:ribosomal protein L29
MNRATHHSTKRNISTAYEARIATTSLAWILVFGALVLACVVGHHYLLEWEHAEEKLIAERIQREEMDPMTKEWEEKLLELQQENVNLRQQHATTEEEPKQEHNMKETKQMISKIHQLQEYKEHMHQAIQVMSKRYVLEK